MLHYTGHPLIDVGIATITAFAQKSDPSTITIENLDEIADYLEAVYSDGIGKNFAAGIVFPNSGFGQPAFDKPEFRHKRHAYAEQVLRGYREGCPILEGETCVFTGEPAYLRATREMFPLLNGRDIINFGAIGTPGIPVSGIALLAIHAMPFGCVTSQGRLLAIASDDPELMIEFARENLERNRRFFQMGTLDSMPNYSAFKTRLVEKLTDVLSRQRLTSSETIPSVTAYHFSNSGQDARIDIYSLPSQVIEFVYLATRPERREAWQRIISNAWWEAKPESEEMDQAKPKLTRRNMVYEDLFNLPDNARAFLGTYILRRPRNAMKRDPRAAYDSLREGDLISWELTDLFLRKMMNMEKTRIDNIRKFGDRLAEYIQVHNDRRLLTELYLARSNEYWKVRAALLRAAQRAQQADDQEPLVAFEMFVSVFEEGEEGERLDWQLARDLLMIRIVEQLHRAKSPSLQALAEVEQEASDTVSAS